MKKIITAVLFAVIAYFIMPFLPWYAIGLLALIFAAFASPDSMLKSFALYFILGFALWYGMSMLADAKTNSLLSSKVGVLFGKLPKQVLLILTGLIGGITSGLGGMTGGTIHQLVFGANKIPPAVEAKKP